MPSVLRFRNLSPAFFCHKCLVPSLMMMYHSSKDHMPYMHGSSSYSPRIFFCFFLQLPESFQSHSISGKELALSLQSLPSFQILFLSQEGYRGHLPTRTSSSSAALCARKPFGSRCTAEKGGRIDMEIYRSLSENNHVFAGTDCLQLRYRAHRLPGREKRIIYRVIVAGRQ